MKKIITILGIILAGGCIFAQDDPMEAAREAAKAMAAYQKKDEAPAEKPNYWKNSLQFDLGLNQTGLFNWAAGGYNTLSLAIGIDASANYAKELMSWGNRLQLNYGFLWSADKRNLLQKSNDRIYLESKWAYKTSKSSKWSYTASLDFRSQFTDSYDNYQQVEGSDDWTGTLKSGFASPAYTNLALGIEWVPTSWLNVNIAPLTGGFTIVTNPLLRNSYGMKLLGEGLDETIGTNFRSSAFQFGAQIKTNMKFVINDKFLFETQLVLFTDYLHEPYCRVNWDNKLEWQLSRLLKLGLSTWLIYDPWVKNGDGSPRGTQFKESAAVSFTYSFQPVRRPRHRSL